MNQNRALIFCFDAFSSREPASTPDQVRGRLSLENALKANRDQKWRKLDPNTAISNKLSDQIARILTCLRAIDASYFEAAAKAD
jgi:hypothetical protein